MGQDTIKSNSIGSEHNKRKNIVVVFVILLFLAIIVSVLMSIFQDSQKKFEKIQQTQKQEKAFSGINQQKGELKESWAMNIENRIEKIQKANDEMLKQTLDAVNKGSEEMNKNLSLWMEKNNENEQMRKEELDNRLNQLTEKMYEEKAAREKQEKELQEQLEKMKNSTVIDNVDPSTLLPIKNVKNKTEEDNSLLPNPRKKKDTEETLKEAVSEAVKEGSKKETSLLPDSKRKNQPPLEMKEVKKLLEEAEERESSAESGKIEKEIEKQLKPENLMVRVIKSYSNDSVEEINSDLIEEEKEEEKEELPYFDLAIGFGKAYMITGAYAPAFQATDTNAIPVLLEAEGEFIMANDNEGSFDKCLLIGTAIAEPAAEAVNIKLAKVSCLSSDGKYRVKGKIKGWVTGDDGTPSIEAELIHKSGAYIVRTILAGVFQGIATGLVNAVDASNTTDDDNNNSTSVIVGDAKEGTANGIKGAFDKISDYYMQMAEKIVPVYQVLGGRTVDFFLDETSEKLQVEKFNKPQIDQMDYLIESLDNNDFESEI